MRQPIAGRNATSRTYISSKTPGYIGIAVLALGMLSLVGWVLDIEALKSVLPGLATMKVNTAIGFILCATALLAQLKPEPEPRYRTIAEAAAAGALLLGLATLAEYLTGGNFGIDHLLSADPSTPEALFPGRMSFSSALDLSLSGFSLLIMAAAPKRIRLWQVLAIVSASIALIALLGYLYGVDALYQVQPFSSMALHTAIGFTLISTGALVARPDQGVMHLFTSRSIGGLVVRRFLPLAIGLPILVGWVSLWGQRHGYYDSTFRLALTMIISALLLFIFVWMIANQLDLTERERNKVQNRFNLAVESAPYAFLITNMGGRIELANAKAEEYFGYTRAELLSGTIDRLVPDRFRLNHPGYRAEYFTSPEVRPMGAGRDLYGLRKDGTEFPVEIGLAPIHTEEGLVILATVIDITIRKQVESRLKEAVADLKRSNAELEQFAYVASHDLQEPLRAISGIVEILQRRYHGQLDETADEYIDLVVDATGRMQTLINDLLEFSRVERRGQPFEQVDLSDSVRQAQRNLTSTIEENGAIISVGDLPTVNADPRQMVSLFQNLIANAIKFRSEEPPGVEISAESGANFWTIRVRDNGIGIDPIYFDRIFVIFQRLHTRREYPGTGIGLSLCKKIVERHGGTIWLESQPGAGSTFFFTLPEGVIGNGIQG